MRHYVAVEIQSYGDRHTMSLRLRIKVTWTNFTFELDFNSIFFVYTHKNIIFVHCEATCAASEQVF